MSIPVQVLFTPADFGALTPPALAGATCVVFDVLRATTTMITALANGAEAIYPVADIAAALALRERMPEALLGGERGGVRIGAALTGGVEFDFGNSPREYTTERVRGRSIVSTTTNGTRALQACVGATTVLAGAFLNLSATARRLNAHPPQRLVLVCAGTGEEAAWEDMLAAGALWDALAASGGDWEVADSAHFARQLYLQSAADLLASMQFSRNARRLLAMPELAEDVAVCLQRDTQPVVAALGTDGALRAG
jgi:2-phosphosulfolactate phosphatase